MTAHRSWVLALSAGGILAGGVLWLVRGAGDGDADRPAVSHRARVRSPAEDRAPLNPGVVGPRLVREAFGPQLVFWLRTYRADGPNRVRRRWTATSRGTIVTLRLTQARRGRPDLKLDARWRIAVPLDGRMTQPQIQVLSGRDGIVPSNAAARLLSSFPRVDPRLAPRSRTVALVAQIVVVDPTRRRAQIAILPADAVPEGIVTRTGRDFALLAGLTLIEHVRTPALTSVRFAGAARIAAGSKPLTERRLAAIANGGALAVVSWRHAGHVSLARLLTRPIDGLELTGVR